jgi:hypothetical protein
MMRGLTTYCFVLLSTILLLGLSACEPVKPPVDWSKNYRTNKKSPYGLYILAQEIEDMNNGFNQVESSNTRCLILKTAPFFTLTIKPICIHLQLT